MRIRTVVLGLLAAAAAGVSCDGEPSETAPALFQPSAPAAQTIARLHWLGKNGLAAQSNAAGLMKLWNLPESAKIEGQTLDRLAAALARWPATNRTPSRNPQLSTSVIRPLLEDLLCREFCLEVRQAGAQAGEWALAIRLDPQRAALWETNLSTALPAFDGVLRPPAQDRLRSWQLPATPQASRAILDFSLARAGDWTLLGLTTDSERLLGEFSARIQRDHAPFQASATNGWLEADFNPRLLAAALALDWPLPEDLARVSFSATGDGATVLEHAEFHFAKPLNLKLEPWTLPAPLVMGQITSFTAVRGFEPWLASLKAWQDAHLGAAPNQAFFWALQGLPVLSFFAAPQPDASNQVSRLSTLVLEKGGPWFATNPAAKFQKAKDLNGLTWKGVPSIEPFLRSAAVGTGRFVFAGLFTASGDTNSSRPLPGSLVKHLQSRAELVAYSWELTGPRVKDWNRIGQTLRMVAQKPQLPSLPLLWLNAASPQLWPSVTEVTQTSPRQLSLERRSSLGMTAVELQLFADWLESPQFPHGLHTLIAPPDEAGPAPPPAPPAR
ncbi:MAG TPA: hypothetical protein VN829_17040, partial [Dongiaceae bacterium]|nr:hypothetical protein [Dongiaceae bacterium]